MRINDNRGNGRQPARRGAASSLIAALMVTVVLALAGCATVVSGTAVRADDIAPVLSDTTSPGGTTAGGATAPSSDATPGSTPGSSATSAVAPSTSSTMASSAAPGTGSTMASSVAPGSSAPGTSAVPTVSTDRLAGASVATVDANGTITLSLPHADHATVVDIYEDALCPYCGRFEQQYGQQIRQAVGQGKLTVRYRLVTFLDQRSASGSYSTRAFAAMLAVAKDSGDRPGVFAAFHAMLFDPAVQPAEGGPDLSDAQLADLARQAGAPQATVDDVAAGRFRQQAVEAGPANLDLLAKDSPNPGTPTVIHDHTVVTTTDPGWLDSLLGG